MKIRVIDPIVKSGKNRELLDQESTESYLKKFLSAGTRLDFDWIEQGFESVESVLHLSFNAPEVVLKVRKAQDEGCEGVFVNCFDDPGVYGAREMADIPVYGGYIPSLLTAAALGGKACILTTDENGLYTEAKKARDNGFEDVVNAVKSVDLPVLELKKKEVLLNRLMDLCSDSILKEKIHTFVLGCTGMSYIAGELREKLRGKGYSAAVIEPMATGVKYLEYILGLGFTNALSGRLDAAGRPVRYSEKTEKDEKGGKGI